MSHPHLALPRTVSLLLAFVALAAAACSESESPAAEVSTASPTTASCDVAAARALVERFGLALRDVSLLAPDPGRAEAMRDAYAEMVAPDLLAAWLAEPRSAPGRAASSPWPDRIEVTELSADGPTCRASGEVVYLTSADAPGEVSSREPVTIELSSSEEGLRITDYRTSAGGPAESPPTTDADAATDARAAADVLREYYAAIQVGDYSRAYSLWGDEGRSSGQTAAEFAAGFAETARVTAEIGEPGRVEGAAGSRYVEIPVVIDAVTRAGERQRFTGSYTLRRAVVDGATAAQRRWHLDSADITAGP